MIDFLYAAALGPRDVIRPRPFDPRNVVMIPTRAERAVIDGWSEWAAHAHEMV